MHGCSQIHGDCPFSSLKYGTDLSSRFPTLKDLLPWLGGQRYIQIDSRKFSRNADIFVIPRKLSEIYLHAWLFSNPQGKDLINQC